MFIISIPGSVFGELSIGKISEVTQAEDGAADTYPLLVEHGSAAYMFWESAPYSGNATRFRYSMLEEDSWSAPGLLSKTDGYYQQDLSVLSHDGLLLAVWISDDPVITTGSDWDIVGSWLNESNNNSWEGPFELTSPGNIGSDYGPELISAGGKTFVVWQTDDTTDSKGSDFDIVLAELRLENGTMELGDSYEVTKGHNGADVQPSALGHGSDIWLAWSSSDPLHTHGNDRDILARTYNTSLVQLGPLYELSPPNGTEDSMSPYLLCSQNGPIAVWHTSEKGITGGSDQDVVVSNYSDSNGWVGPWEVTPAIDSGSDAYPMALEFNEELVFLWESNDPGTSSGNDWDLVFWSNSCGDQALELTPVKDASDESGISRRGFSAMVHDNELLVVWASSNPDITNGSDLDIVSVVISEFTAPGGNGDDEKVKEDTGNDMKDDILIPVLIMLVGVACIILYLGWKKGLLSR